MSEIRERVEQQEKVQEPQEQRTSTTVQDEQTKNVEHGEERRMEGNGKAALLEQFAEIYAQLDPQEVEEFYSGYHLWKLQQRATILEKQIEILREHLRKNGELIEQSRPSAIAQAVLARLQANGVFDVELLDRMLERGEEWLDKTMQHLDYCEQVEDFIRGDYLQWCRHALEGAYDWIDSMLEAAETGNEPAPAMTGETAEEIRATEQILLQKLSSDDETAMLEITLKRPAFKLRRRDTQPLQEEMARGVEEVAQADGGYAENVGDAENTQGRRNTQPLVSETETEPVTEEDVAVPASKVEDMQTIEEVPDGLGGLQEANVEIEPVEDEAQEAEGENDRKPGDEDEAAESVIERDRAREDTREEDSEVETAAGMEKEASVQESGEAQVELTETETSIEKEYIPVAEAHRIEAEVAPASDEESLVEHEEGIVGEISPATGVEKVEGVEATLVQEETIEYWEEEDAGHKISGGDGKEVEITWWVEPAAQIDKPGERVVQPEVSVPTPTKRRVGFWRRLLGWFWKT